MINNMRSNDIIYGTTYDIPWTSLVHQSMLLELEYEYPNLKLGRLIHTANSLHIYERMYKTADKMLQTIWSDYSMHLETPLTESLLDTKDKLGKAIERFNICNEDRQYQVFIESLIKCKIKKHAN